MQNNPRFDEKQYSKLAQQKNRTILQQLQNPNQVNEGNYNKT